MPSRPPVHRPVGWQSPALVQRNQDRARGTAAQRGYDSEWRAFRAGVLKVRRICETPGCGSSKMLNLHHVKTMRVAPARRLDPTNVRVLCQVCHSRQTARHDGGYGRG